MDQKFIDTPWATSGDKTTIPDPVQGTGTVSFAEGWNLNYARDQLTDPLALPIDRSATNYLMYVITQILQQYQEHSMPEWISPANNLVGGVATPFAYAKHAICRYSATVPGVTFETYVSTIDANTDVPGATANWQPVSDFVATALQASTGTDNRAIITSLTLAQQTALRALLAGNGTQVFNVGPATALTHAPETTQVQGNAFNYGGLAGGTANALTTTLTPAPVAYVDNLEVVVRVAANNTAATTINVNGLGVKTVVGGAHAALQGGELFATGFACFIYSVSLGQFILAWATGGSEQVANATQSQQAVPLGQLTAVGVTPGRKLRHTVWITVGGTLMISVDGAAFVASASTITAHPLATVAELLTHGSGGGGGLAASTATGQVSGGGGGSAGNWAWTRLLSTAYNGAVLTVPAGGAPGAPGAACSIGALISALGGQAGSTGATQTANNNFNGGTPPNTPAATFARRGAGGIGWGAFYGTSIISGKGGNSLYGEGALYVSGIPTTGTVGITALSWGAGGSGGASGSAVPSNILGGSGGTAVAELVEYA